MTSEKNAKMMNADLETGFGFPSTVSKPFPMQDTKVPITDDLKKHSSCWNRKLIALAALILSSLLVGMILATVVIFSLGVHREREMLVHEGRHNQTGEHHHRHKQNHTDIADTTDIGDEEDGDEPGPETKCLWWMWWCAPSWEPSWYSFSSDDSSSSDYLSSSDYWFSSDPSSDTETPNQPPTNPEQPPTNPEQPPTNPEQPPTNPEQPPTNQECGRGNVSPYTSDTKIVNGDTVVNEMVWPWASYLSDGDYFFCGAELVDQEWAVTAAHCVDGLSANERLKITFGQINQNAGNSNTRVIRGISQIVKHPGYNANTIDNDIALLKLSTPVNENTAQDGANRIAIPPVCINANVDESNIYQPDDCFVVGWGATSFGGPTSGTLQQVKSPLVNRDLCKAAYGDSAITEQMICTSTNHKDSPSGSCQGDSGGPMMCRKQTVDGDVWHLVGVTSWGNGCADTRYPDVLARVSKFVDWINETMRPNDA